MTGKKFAIVKDFFSTPKKDKVRRLLLHRYIEGGLLSGAIKLQTVNEREILSAFYSHLIKLKKEFRPTLAAVTHLPTLLAEARRMKMRGQEELAIVLYATWFEHWINGFLKWLFIKQNQELLFMPFIRKIDLISKYKLLVPFKLPTIKSTCIKTIKDTSEQRNQIVHYKWNLTDLHSDDKKNLKQLFPKVERAIKYLNRYEDTHLLGISRIRFKEIMMRAMNRDSGQLAGKP